MPILRRWITALLLFLLALAVRLPGLGGFSTIDEPRWLDRSRWFLTGVLFPAQECPAVEWGREFATHGLGCTLQIGYPGVTTMWSGSMGLLLYYWQRVSSTGMDLFTFLTTLPINNFNADIIGPTRLPLAVAGALFVPFFYLLLQKLFSSRAALLAALVVALHPFHIALSRVLHHDALTATFMVLSLLALVGYWLHRWQWYWLPISAMLGGLALLSKQVSWFLPPFIVVLAGFTLLYRWSVENSSLEKGQELATASTGPLIWAEFRHIFFGGVLWGIVAALTVIALFPAMWIDPLDVLQVIYSASTGLAGEGHTHYFFGEISNNPGPLFYPVGWLLRATPPEMVGILSIGVAGVWHGIRHPSLKKLIRKQPVAVVLFLFVGLLWLFVSMSDKKLVRYFLPAFPIIDVFVAFGLLWLLDRGMTVWQFITSNELGDGVRDKVVFATAGIILIIQGQSAVSHYPYYLTYYNPLTGGASGAAQVMTIIGWGEGLNEAGAFLNQQPHAEEAQVITERFCSMLRPFFVGRVSCLNSSLGGILQADYVVYYYNVVQRELQWPEQWRYLVNHYKPVHRVEIEGLDYVSIYQNPIAYRVDPTANGLSNVLTAFGYHLTTEGQLTVVWQNLATDQLWVGLARTEGVYPDDGPTSGDRHWLACPPAPDFVLDLDTPKAIIESNCPLADAELSAGLYDAQLAFGNTTQFTPIKSSRLAVLLIDGDGHFENVELVEGGSLPRPDIITQ